MVIDSVEHKGRMIELLGLISLATSGDAKRIKQTLEEWAKEL